MGGMAGSTGLEPAASGVTGRRSNQLNYDPDSKTQLEFKTPSGIKPKSEALAEASRSGALVGGEGFEPATPCV